MMEASRYVYRDPLDGAPTALAPAEKPPAAADYGDDRFDLWQIMLKLWEGRLLIVAGTAASAIVALAISLSLPKKYQAMATIFITPPTFTTDLRPPSFSVEAYERLARSEYMQNQVVQELRKTNAISATQGIGRLDTMLYVSREPQKPYLPLVGLIAEDEKPQKAQLVANTWATLFAQEERKLTTAGGSADFILTEYPKASTDLAEEERKLSALRQQQSKTITDAQMRLAPGWKQTQLTSVEQLIVGLEEDLAKTRVELRESEQAMKQAEAELKGTPSVLATTKALSDDALLEAAGKSTPPGTPASIPASVASSRLQTEEINPTYTAIAKRLADERVNHAALQARRDGLVREIAEAQRRLADLRVSVLTGELALETLQRNQELQRNGLERSVGDAEARFKRLEAKVADARIAKAIEEPNVKVGALAGLPKSQSSPRVKVNVAIATVMGFLISLVGVWVMTHLRSPNRSAVQPVG